MKSIVLALMAISLWSQPLWAEQAESEFTAMFKTSCRQLAIPHDLAMAIARVESDLKPWTLNIAGRSYRFDSRDEALVKAREAWEAGRPFDVGLMQVNDWWLRKYGLSPEVVIDPLANIYFGGWILKQELDRYGGDVKKAVGSYHSPDPARARRYAALVMKTLEGGPQSVDNAPHVRRLNRGNGRAANRSHRENEAVRAAQPSPMLISSRRKILVQPQSMKTAGTAAQKSMKVKYEN